LKWDGTDLGPLVKVDVGGATGKTDGFGVQNFQLCGEGAGCADGLDTTGLDGGNQMPVTLDSPQNIDATDNIDPVTTESTDSYVKGSTSGTALVTVRYNASNVLKIFVGVTEYDPTIGVYGSRDFGISDVLALSTSISLIKLF